VGIPQFKTQPIKHVVTEAMFLFIFPNHVLLGKIEGPGAGIPSTSFIYLLLKDVKGVNKPLY